MVKRKDKAEVRMRYLDALQDLQYLLSVSGGKINFSEFIKKHRLGGATPTILVRDGLLKRKRDGVAFTYQWNTVDPNPDMVEELLRKIAEYNREKYEAMQERKKQQEREEAAEVEAKKREERDAECAEVEAEVNGSEEKQEAVEKREEIVEYNYVPAPKVVERRRVTWSFIKTYQEVVTKSFLGFKRTTKQEIWELREKEWEDIKSDSDTTTSDTITVKPSLKKREQQF